MSKLFQTAFRYRLFIVVLSIVAIFVGGANLLRMPVNLLPDFTPTLVEVQTEAPGLSAQEVEAMITVPLEADMLNGIPWLEQLESRSITGLSSIELIFEPGTDLMVARQMVQERLTAAHALPNVSKPPIMRQPVGSEARVVQIGLTSEELSLIDMSVLARWTIIPRLTGVRGVANVSIWGERQRQMQVIANPDVLAQQGVLLEDVIRTSGNSLWVSPLSYLQASTPGTGGFIDTPNQRLGIQHVFPIVTPTDMMGLPLVNNPTLAIGDIAEVVEGHPPLIGDALINGKPGLMLVVEKFPWASSAEVARNVEHAMTYLQPGMPGVAVEMGIFSAGEIAHRAANRIRLVAVIGVVAAVLLIALAVRDLRITTLAAVTAVTALLLGGGAIVGLVDIMDGALLAGIFAAFGLVLHDAVQGAVPRGTDEDGRIRSTMIVTTLAAILVVVPLFFLGQVGGVVSTAVAWSYIIVIAVSLLASLFVAPAMSALLAGNDQTGARVSLTEGPKGLNGGLPLPQGLAVVGVLVLAGATVIATATLAPESEFRNKNVLVEWTSPPGTSLEAVMAGGRNLSDALLASDMVEHTALQVGRAEMSDEVLNANAGTLWVTVAPDRHPKTAATEIGAIIAGAGLNARVTSYQSRQIERSALNSDDADLVVRVYGHEYDRLTAKAEEVAGQLSVIEGVDAAAIRTPQLEPVIEVEVDLAKARDRRTKPGDVRRAVAAFVGGIEVGSFFEDQKVFGVVVWGDTARRTSIEAMQALMIDVPGGKVPLTDVAEVRVSKTPAFINRSAVSRFIEIAVTAPAATPSLVGQMEEALASMDFPLEYHAEVVGGAAFDAGSGDTPLWQVAVAALIGVVLLMQLQLDGWVRAGLAVACAAAVGAIAVLVTFLLGAWTAAAAVGAAAAMGIGLRDAATVMRNGISRSEVPTLLVANAAAVVALLPTVVLFAPGLEFVWTVSVALISGLIGSAALSHFVLPALSGDKVAAPTEAPFATEQANA